MNDNSTKIVLDLCGGTGAWSKPYKEAGYDVRLITLPDYDVRTYQPPENVHGILAAPPCTYFCTMRMCRGKPTREQLGEGLEIVEACMRIIWKCRPEWWALENPRGYLHDWLGEPRLKFQPWEYGDAWTKGTWIWGRFCRPAKLFPVKPNGSLVRWHDGPKQRGWARNAEQRSITPPGFAKAFMEANP